VQNGRPPAPAERVLLRALALSGMGFFLLRWVIAFGHGLKPVMPFVENGRYFFGDGKRAVEVPGWLYAYHYAFEALFLPALLVSAWAGTF
jgi:hypothetical protein